MSYYLLLSAQICRKQTVVEVFRADIDLAPAEPLSGPGLYARCLTCASSSHWILIRCDAESVSQLIHSREIHSMCHAFAMCEASLRKKKNTRYIGSLTSPWKCLGLKKKRRMDRFGQFITSNHSAFHLWDPFLHVWKWLLHWFSSCHMICYKPAQCKWFKANSPLLIQKEWPFVSIT